METVNATPTRFDSQIGQSVKVLDRGLNLRSRSVKDESQKADQVNVSRDALLYTEALRGAQNAPDMRQDKIDLLRAKIADGTYEIDSTRLAMDILREEPALFRRI